MYTTTIFVFFFMKSKMGTSNSLLFNVEIVVPSLSVDCLGMLSHTILLVRRIIGHGGHWRGASLFPRSLQWYLPVGWLVETVRVFIGSAICSSSIWAWAGTCSAIHRRKFITTRHQLYIWNHNKYFYFIEYIPESWLGCSPPTWGNSPPSCGTYSVPLQSFLLLPSYPSYSSLLAFWSLLHHPMDRHWFW